GHEAQASLTPEQPHSMRRRPPVVDGLLMQRIEEGAGDDERSPGDEQRGEIAERRVPIGDMLQDFGTQNHVEARPVTQTRGKDTINWTNVLDRAVRILLDIQPRVAIPQTLEIVSKRLAATAHVKRSRTRARP